LRELKIIFISILIAVSVGFMDLGDTSALENDADKITISKDAEPNFSQINFADLGTMTASWYGSKFHGKTTANGETYNQLALTAAHKTLAFGTLLKITNMKNGKSAIVRINDRGPYIGGRDIDLSKGTAIALGMVKRGVQKVKVEELNTEEDISPINVLN
jgi:rare lipoprotein A